MTDPSMEFLTTLLDTPSVSGYEQPIQQVVRDYARDFADEISTDAHGNVTVAVNPGGHPRILFAAHCDQIGFMVQRIDSDGFIRFSGIGGHDGCVLIGQNVTIWTDAGAVPGVIGRKAIHLLTGSERGKTPETHKLWIDIGAKDEDEAAEVVQIGDPITYALGATRLRNNLIASPALDNKAGVWAAMEATRALAASRDFDAAVFAVSTVQEELGTRGVQTAAYRIDPHIGLAVDVNHATDIPGVDKNQHGDVTIGGGAVIVRGPNINPRVFEIAVNAAKSAEIPYQTVGYPRPTPTDARTIQVTRAGVATGLIKIPNRYMHTTVEVISLGDLEHTARLFAAFVRAVERDTDFTP